MIGKTGTYICLATYRRDVPWPLSQALGTRFPGLDKQFALFKTCSKPDPTEISSDELFCEQNLVWKFSNKRTGSSLSASESGQPYQKCFRI